MKLAQVGDGTVNVLWQPAAAAMEPDFQPYHKLIGTEAQS